MAHVEEYQPTTSGGTINLNLNEEYQAFEALARKLVNVPKREIDEQREQHAASA